MASKNLQISNFFVENKSDDDNNNYGNNNNNNIGRNLYSCNSGFLWKSLSQHSEKRFIILIY